MGLSFEDWRACVKDRPDADELLARYPDGSDRRAITAERVREIREALAIEPPKPKHAKLVDGMNKTELDFARALGNNVLKPPFHRWEREPIKLRLAGRTWYTPDFGVWFPCSTEIPFTLVEVKGFMRDDAAVKLKVAASMYPEWRWLLAYRDGRNGWSVYEVNNRGIGREPIAIPWIGE